MKKIFLSLPPCGSFVSRLTGSPCRELVGQQLPEEAEWAATNPSTPCETSTKLFGRDVAPKWSGCGVGLRLLGRYPYPAAPDRSGLRPGSARGIEGLLLEDDPAVRVQSGGALVSRALWAAKLVASDGPMNVPNERRSVESDEETFMDRHGRSLHLVGRTCRMTRSDRPFVV
jgi:hypothetical protein